MEKKSLRLWRAEGCLSHQAEIHTQPGEIQQYLSPKTWNVRSQAWGVTQLLLSVKVSNEPKTLEISSQWHCVAHARAATAG